MSYALPLKAIEESTYIITANFIDENGEAFSPVTLNWSLTDPSGNIINDREDVVVESPESTEHIVLSGDDLAIGTNYPCWRRFCLSGTYDSTLGNGLPINSVALFQIITLADVGKITQTITDMIALLGVYLEDTDKNEYTPAFRVSLLNQAQTKVLIKTNRYIFEELDAVALSQSLDSEGSFNLAELSIPVFHNDKGIDSIKLSGGKFCNRISFSEYRNLVDAGTVFNVDDPIYYIRGKKLYIEPYSNQTIDIYYMREQANMAIDSYSDKNVNCELDESIKNIIVGLACETYANKIESANMAYKNALESIAELNERTMESESSNRGITRNLTANGRRFNILNC